MPSTSTAERVRNVVVVVAFVVSVISTIAQPWCGRDRLSAAEVAVVVARHASTVQRGDIVLVHPPWRDDIVNAVRPLFPADTLVTEAFTRGHNDGWPALVVVAEGVHPWPASIEARRVTVGAEVVVEGDIRFFRLPQDGGPTPVPRKTPARASTNQLELDRASVVVIDAQQRTTTCAWSADRRQHVCDGLPEWMRVADEALVIDGEKQRCTWAHPATKGRVTIHYEDVDLARGLRLQAALSDVAADNKNGAPVTFTLRVGDLERVVVVHHDHGFKNFDLPPQPTEADVDVIVTTDNDGQRHACYRLGAP